MEPNRELGESLIAVNLLPAEARRISHGATTQWHRLPITWVAGSALLLFVVGLLVLGWYRRFEVRQLTTRLEQLKPERVQVEQLQRGVHRLQAQEQALKGLMVPAQQWTGYLALLSKAAPDGIWYTELVLDHEDGFRLEGLAIERQGAEMASIGRLVQILKSDPIFAARFPAIQIDSVKRVQDRDVEMVDFLLVGGRTATR